MTQHITSFRRITKPAAVVQINDGYRGGDIYISALLGVYGDSKQLLKKVVIEFHSHRRIICFSTTDKAELI